MKMTVIKMDEMYGRFYIPYLYNHDTVCYIDGTTHKDYNIENINKNILKLIYTTDFNIWDSEITIEDVFKSPLETKLGKSLYGNTTT